MDRRGYKPDLFASTHTHSPPNKREKKHKIDFQRQGKLLQGGRGKKSRTFRRGQKKELIYMTLERQSVRHSVVFLFIQVENSH